jgi:hypothetical protein
MPVVEYKLEVINNKGGATAPLWVDDGGYHSSPIDKTKVGWVLPEVDREYYVPDTVTELSKSEFVTRQLAIHAVQPFMNDSEPTEDDEDNDPTEMTNAEVTTEMESWYDSFVSSHS